MAYHPCRCGRFYTPRPLCYDCALQDAEEVEELRESERILQQVADVVLTSEVRRKYGHDCWADIPDEVKRLKALDVPPTA